MLDKTDGFMPKNCMSGYDFELWVQGILTALKFDAKRTKGNDIYTENEYFTPIKAQNKGHPLTHCICSCLA